MVGRGGQTAGWRGMRAAAFGSALLVFRATSAFAQEASEAAKEMTPEVRAKLAAATLLVLLLGVVIVVVVWLLSRSARAFMRRGPRPRRPSGQVGPSDWEASPLADAGWGERTPDGSLEDEADDEAGDGENGSASDSDDDDD